MGSRPKRDKKTCEEKSIPALGGFSRASLWESRAQQCGRLENGHSSSPSLAALCTSLLCDLDASLIKRWGLYPESGLAP